MFLVFFVFLFFFLFLFHLLLVTYRYIFYHAIYYKLFLNIGDTDGIFFIYLLLVTRVTIESTYENWVPKTVKSSVRVPTDDSHLSEFIFTHSLLFRNMIP